MKGVMPSESKPMHLSGPADHYCAISLPGASVTTGGSASGELNASDLEDLHRRERNEAIYVDAIRNWFSKTEQVR